MTKKNHLQLVGILLLGLLFWGMFTDDTTRFQNAAPTPTPARNKVHTLDNLTTSIDGKPLPTPVPAVHRLSAHAHGACAHAATLSFSSMVVMRVRQ